MSAPVAPVLLLLLVACLLPPPRGEAAPNPSFTPPPGDDGPAPAPRDVAAWVLSPSSPPVSNAKASMTAKSDDGRVRLPGQHYTMQRHRKKSLSLPRTGASTGDTATAKVPVPGPGVADGEAVDVSSTVTDKTLGMIIRVPSHRSATGCRLYQRTDRLGRCRNRW